MCLTYDMTFLALLLDSLDEPELQSGSRPCLAHPCGSKTWRQSKWTAYCADMNVALAYHNCLDDWQDDHNVVKYAYALTLKGSYRRIQKQWPRQCEAIEAALHELSGLEKANSADLDGTAACFGRLMAALLTPDAHNFFNNTLSVVGDRLGRFIYVMDAVLDEEADKKEGHYNPVTRFEQEHGSLDRKRALELLLGECAMAFESLPLEQDLDLLRNILYAGVWVKWNARLEAQQ